MLERRTEEFRERFANPYVAAERGYVDAVIDPADTRALLTAGLSALGSKRDANPVAEARQHSPVRSLGRVLVANRGEIAVRVLSAAAARRGSRRRRSFPTADRRRLPRAGGRARPGDRAGPRARIVPRRRRILDAARRLEAGSVHPGYGFLAENAAFAEAVEESGLLWIGPPPAAIRAMGEKTAARRAMQAAGVPVVPGTVEPLAEPAAAGAAAAETGYPVLLKAAAGGGGKGMRVVGGPARARGRLRRRVAGGAGSVRRSCALPGAVHPRGRGMSRSRSLPTGPAARSTSASENARSSAGIRRCSRSAPPRASPSRRGSGWARSPCARRRPLGTWAPARSSSCSRPTIPSGSWR